MKEYLTRMKKIWQSELSSFNEVIAHNTFTIPVLTTTVGLQRKKTHVNAGRMCQ